MTKENFILGMAGIIILLTFLYLFLITFLQIPESGADHAKYASGFLVGTAFATIINYFWGSSKGSADKNDLLNRR